MVATASVLLKIMWACVGVEAVMREIQIGTMDVNPLKLPADQTSIAPRTHIVAEKSASQHALHHLSVNLLKFVLADNVLTYVNMSHQLVE